MHEPLQDAAGGNATGNGTNATDGGGDAAAEGGEAEAGADEAAAEAAARAIAAAVRPSVTVERTRARVARQGGRGGAGGAAGELRTGRIGSFPHYSLTTHSDPHDALTSLAPLLSMARRMQRRGRWSWAEEEEGAEEEEKEGLGDEEESSYPEIGDDLLAAVEASSGGRSSDSFRRAMVRTQTLSP